MRKTILILVSLFLIECGYGQLLENSHAQKQEDKKTDYESWFSKYKLNEDPVSVSYSSWWLQENESSKFVPKYVLKKDIKGRLVSVKVSEQDSYEVLKSKLNGELQSNVNNEIMLDTPIYTQFKKNIDETKKEIITLGQNFSELKQIIDSPITAAKDKMLLTEFHSSLLEKKNNIEKLNTSIEGKKDSMNILIEKLKEIKADTITKYIIFQKTDSQAVAITAKLEGIKRRLESFSADIIAQKAGVKQKLEEFKKVNQPTEPKEENIAALPFLSSIPGIKSISGSLSVFGNKTVNIDKSSLYAEFGGFIGATGTTDEQNINSLFIPESSKYAFFIKASLGFDRSSATERIGRLGLNFNFYYAGKKIVVDTVINKNGFNISLFQTKIGVEYILLRDLLSTYVNVNALAIGSNVGEFEKATLNTKKVKGFVDWGIRMLLDPNKNLSLGNFKLFFDLNFLINGGDLKSLNKSSDFIIPNIRFGIRKGFRI